MEKQNESYIEIKTTPKGQYYWNIKVTFNPVNDKVEEGVPAFIKLIDQQLRDKFPNNVMELNKGNSSTFKEIPTDW